MPDRIAWVDIPVLNIDRAMKFYGPLFDVRLQKEEQPGFSMAILPHEDGEVGGCLLEMDKEGFTPTDRGLLLYLNVNGRLDEALATVIKNGGKVLEPKHAIGPYGFRAIILDSEGNRLALHSES